jgi:hypothetical protein
MMDKVVSSGVRIFAPDNNLRKSNLAQLKKFLLSFRTTRVTIQKKTSEFKSDGERCSYDALQCHINNS